MPAALALGSLVGVNTFKNKQGEGCWGDDENRREVVKQLSSSCLNLDVHNNTEPTATTEHTATTSPAATDENDSFSEEIEGMIGDCNCTTENLTCTAMMECATNITKELHDEDKNRTAFYAAFGDCLDASDSHNDTDDALAQITWCGDPNPSRVLSATTPPQMFDFLDSNDNDSPIAPSRRLRKDLKGSNGKLALLVEQASAADNAADIAGRGLWSHPHYQRRRRWSGWGGWHHHHNPHDHSPHRHNPHKHNPLMKDISTAIGTCATAKAMCGNPTFGACGAGSQEITKSCYGVCDPDIKYSMHASCVAHDFYCSCSAHGYFDKRCANIVLRTVDSRSFTDLLYLAAELTMDTTFFTTVLKGWWADTFPPSLNDNDLEGCEKVGNAQVFLTLLGRAGKSNSGKRLGCGNSEYQFDLVDWTAYNDVWRIAAGAAYIAGGITGLFFGDVDHTDVDCDPYPD